MCLPFATSTKSSVRSDLDPQPGPRPYKPENQNPFPTDIPTSQSHSRYRRRHQPSCGDKHDHPYGLRYHSPHRRRPDTKRNDTEDRHRDGKPQVESVPVHAANQSRHNMTSSNQKGKPQFQDTNHINRIKPGERQKIQSQADKCQNNQTQASEHRKIHTEASQPQFNTENSLLNGQGIPMHAIKPSTKETILLPGKNPQPKPQQSRNGKSEKADRAAVQLKPEHGKPSQDFMPTIRESVEPKKQGASHLFQRRRHPRPTRRVSSKRNTGTGNSPYNHSFIDSDDDDSALSPVKDTRSTAACVRLHRCSGCGINVSISQTSASEGICPACLGHACLHPVTRGGNGICRQKGMERVGGDEGVKGRVGMVVEEREIGSIQRR